jgi:hypothetical protein
VRRLLTALRARSGASAGASSTRPWVGTPGAQTPMPHGTAGLRAFVRELGAWPRRRWVVALSTAFAVGLVIGTPTDVVPNPLYVRMTPVTWWNYPIWAVSAVLAGLVVATYVRVGPTPNARRDGATAFGGGAFSVLAVGCPICNKLVVAALGTGGALSYFGPVQPIIGVASLALLGVALALRLRAHIACKAMPHEVRVHE